MQYASYADSFVAVFLTPARKHQVYVLQFCNEFTALNVDVFHLRLVTASPLLLLLELCLDLLLTFAPVAAR